MTINETPKDTQPLDLREVLHTALVGGKLSRLITADRVREGRVIETDEKVRER